MQIGVDVSDHLFSVKDQVVLVSGGSRGIGRAIAAEFAAREAQVVITGRDRSTLDTDRVGDLRKRRGRSCRWSAMWLATRGIAATVDRVISEFGRIDTLVNVAGVNRRKPALEITEEDYDYVMNINLRGAFLLSQAVGRHMIGRASGSQINVTSLNNDRPLRNVSPYAMSKAALGHMTRALALEWSAFGIRVNAIAPGFILTDLTQKLWSDPQMQAWNRANTPQQRLGQPEDLVGTAIFLASPASAFLTGKFFTSTAVSRPVGPGRFPRTTSNWSSADEAMSEPAPSTQRIVSLDQFRGYTVVGMFLVNFVGGFEACHYVLRHYNTFCSYADTIMPQFFFAVGFAFRLTFLKRAQTQGLASAYGRTVRRLLRPAARVLCRLHQSMRRPTRGTNSWTKAVWQAIRVPLKRDWFQTLTHIAVTSLWILPVIRSGWIPRLLYMVGSAALHVALSYWFYFAWVNNGQPNGIDGGPLGFLTWTIPTIIGTFACDILLSRAACCCD